MIPALPANELARLAMLQRYALLDTSPDPMFDDIVSMAARVLSVPVATVTLVDADRQWFKACVGVPNQSVAREHSFCAHTILTDQLLVVPDLTADPRFRDNPLVAGAPLVRFYAGVPLAGEDGSLVGVLCIMRSAAPRAERLGAAHAGGSRRDGDDRAAPPARDARE